MKDGHELPTQLAQELLWLPQMGALQDPQGPWFSSRAEV